ncbi:MAG: helix-hairpin-helix domain-containing protein [Nitrosomonas sp.]
MPKHNADIATIFEEIADLLEIQKQDVLNTRSLQQLRPLISRTMQKSCTE